MTDFTPRKLDNGEGLGEKLRQARLFKNLKAEDIAHKLNIRASYLLALEEENFDGLPAGLYGRNYLKKYAAYLKLNVKEMLKSWDESMDLNRENDPFSQRVVERNKFIVFPKIIRNILIGIAVLICFLYLIFYVRNIIFAPVLEVTQPEKNISTQERSILITGETAKEAEVKINGETVLNNQGGSFSQSVNLKKGLNEIVVKSKKKYSKERTVIRQILVE